ncbi:MAG: MurR/RpiR family transcriptional regulator [Clostridia bacterium]|nr:MurR/RpiR family transcriptional regulator [Clostridia bacterium]
MENNVLEQIEARLPSLSKSQKKIGEFIITHYDKAVFMTALKLGHQVGVSESTVVRFANVMGYEGFPELQEALGDVVKTRLTSVQRHEIAVDKMENKDILAKVISADISKLKNTLEQIDRVDFDNAVEAILKAKNIYVMGVRSASALASFLGFYLNLIFDNVKLVHTNSMSEMFEQILRVNEKDVVIGITFPRYSRRTVQSMQYAKKRGANVIGITDTPKSPVVESCTTALFAKSDMVSFVDSLVAPMSVINALIVALGLRKQDEVKDTLGQLEDIWEEYNVYNKVKPHE